MEMMTSFPSFFISEVSLLDSRKNISGAATMTSASRFVPNGS